MGDRENKLGEPTNWSGAKLPAADLALKGKYVAVKRVSETDGLRLLETFRQAEIPASDWLYLPWDAAGFFAQAGELHLSVDPVYFILTTRGESGGSGKVCGYCSYLRINPQAGSIEIGFIHILPEFQRSREFTEAMHLLIAKAFEMGYRRCEWKCDSLNMRSRRSAIRFGFGYEGLFRQARVVKGRNRDTAWFSITDKEWVTLDGCYRRWLDAGNFTAGARQVASLSSMTRPLVVDIDPAVLADEAQGSAQGFATDAVKLALSDMASRIPDDAAQRFHIGLARGQLQVELYIPKGQDLQKPHDRDECYVVTRGTGRFVMGDRVVDFKAGDFLFVPAGMEHRFIDFGESMETWVIFYGPLGGEGGECRGEGGVVGGAKSG